jgi:hypothetical protein
MMELNFNKYIYLERDKSFKLIYLKHNSRVLSYKPFLPILRPLHNNGSNFQLLKLETFLSSRVRQWSIWVHPSSKRKTLSNQPTVQFARSCSILQNVAGRPAPQALGKLRAALSVQQRAGCAALWWLWLYSLFGTKKQQLWNYALVRH